MFKMASTNIYLDLTEGLYILEYPSKVELGFTRNSNFILSAGGLLLKSYTLTRVKSYYDPVQLSRRKPTSLGARYDTNAKLMDGILNSR